MELPKQDLNLSPELANRIFSETFSDSWVMFERHLLQPWVSSLIKALVSESDALKIAALQAEIRFLEQFVRTIRMNCKRFLPQEPLGDEDLQWSGYRN